jgi:CDP-glycerol glycerophosphotransferase
LASLLPKQNKIIASTFEGKKYGDNTQYIVEALHRINPKLDIVWIRDDSVYYEIPEWMRSVCNQNSQLKIIYEYATAKVWIDTHRLKSYFYKRENQLFIETWHGGLGIKRLDGDVPKFQKMRFLMCEVKTTSKLADLFISNSKHLSEIYRSAFRYKGTIWKCGYPKNDILLSNAPNAKKTVCQFYNIPEKSKILIYAPTFRDQFRDGILDMRVYNIDYSLIMKELNRKTGNEWYILTRFHPFMVEYMGKKKIQEYHVINATEYSDMQELILAADAFISDYSSCIFDAALRNIPCFTFATDFEEYKADRGVYYEMEELPFPYAKNNVELTENIRNFNYDEYIKKWEAFKVRTGLYETGHAAKDIAYVINEYIKGNTKPLEDIQSEP